MQFNAQAALSPPQQSAQAVFEYLIPARQFGPNLPFCCLALWPITSSTRIPKSNKVGSRNIGPAEIVPINGIPDPFVAEPCPLPLKNQERVFRYNNLLQ
jgi:hypothetical protein